MKFKLTKFSALEPVKELEVGHWLALKELGFVNYIELLLLGLAVAEIDPWSFIVAERCKDL